MKNTWIILFLLCSCVTNRNLSSHPYSGSTIGCGSFTVYKLTQMNKGFLSVRYTGDYESLSQESSIDLSKTQLFTVQNKFYDGSIKELLCNDVLINPPIELSNEEAIAGELSISMTKEDFQSMKSGRPYEISVRLKNIQFESGVIEYIELENVLVGWLPG